MGVISVVNNLPAMFTERQISINTGSRAKSTEKLSSGYQINRAGDDAAGLAISEKLRRQIRGLGKATENICDGISFVQTGEGYLNEVHDMIQRVNELAVQSANGTNSEQDRQYINQEVQQLKEEMKRIYDTAEFNEKLIFKMPYCPEPEISLDEGDIQVFNSGIDTSGNPVWGGVEINGVRHTWDELGIGLSDDGQTFQSTQEISFSDYTGERVVLNVKQGDALSEVSRNYEWKADENGIYVNNVFASSWEDMGISRTGDNSGEFSFQFRNMTIRFNVEGSDSLDKIITGINGDGGVATDCTWDVAVGFTERSKALNSGSPIQIQVTNANKDLINLNYYVTADSNGVSIRDADGQTTGHTKMLWGETQDDFRDTSGAGGDYPISDWGVGDADGRSVASNLVTFDDQAVYTYEDNSNASLPISFSFTMKDETSRDAAIAALNGARLAGSIYAPGTVTASASTASAPQVAVSRNLMDYETQLSYGRDFNDASASLTGTITRTLVLEGSINMNSPSYVNQSQSSPAIVTEASAVKYISDGAGQYYKVTLSGVTTSTTTYERDAKTSSTQKAHYAYSGTFAGQSMTDVAGRSFQLAKTETTHQKKINTDVTFTSAAVDMGTTYAISDIDPADVITQDQLDNKKISAVQEWHNVGTTTEDSRTGLTFIDEVKVSTAKGDAFVLQYQNKAENTDTSIHSMTFQANGRAYRNFELVENLSRNTSEKAVFTDITVHTPKKQLWIHSCVEAGEGILLEWSALNNAVTGMSSVDVSTEKSASVSISYAKKALQVISQVRSDFGAYQNRMEHAKNINDNIQENTQAAESRIRDTDMAKEMVRLSMLNVLSQAQNSMQTQANQNNQVVLGLLQ